MYQWYEAAGVCYVYLADVPTGLGPGATTQAVRKSRWFSRGWTLRELIAPESIIFYNNNWEELGTKDSLRLLISHITTIKREALQSPSNVMDFSVAQRISWASMREPQGPRTLHIALWDYSASTCHCCTGRVTEHSSGFKEEIPKTTVDHSILAWKRKDSQNASGLLASSPADSSQCDNLIHVRNSSSSPVSTTSRGIHLQVRKKRLLREKLDTYTGWSEIFIAILDCQETAGDNRIAIYLSNTHDGCQRVLCDVTKELDEAEVRNGKVEDIYVRQHHVYSSLPSHHRLFINIAKLEEHGIRLQETFSSPQGTH
jgi:hypothetical protein